MALTSRKARAFRLQACGAPCRFHTFAMLVALVVGFLPPFAQLGCSLRSQDSWHKQFGNRVAQ
eukprot:4683413-Pyramimonas_sp.AAC.1